jgi:hypothetical protein
MPSLFRFLFLCGVIAATAYGIVFSLAVFVEPRPRDIIVRIPSERVNPPSP